MVANEAKGWESTIHHTRVRLQLVTRTWSYRWVDSIWLEKKEKERKQLLIMPFTQGYKHPPGNVSIMKIERQNEEYHYIRYLMYEI